MESLSLIRGFSKVAARRCRVVSKAVKLRTEDSKLVSVRAMEIAKAKMLSGSSISCALDAALELINDEYPLFLEESQTSGEGSSNGDSSELIDLVYAKDEPSAKLMEEGFSILKQLLSILSSNGPVSSNVSPKTSEAQRPLSLILDLSIPSKISEPFLRMMHATLAFELLGYSFSINSGHWLTQENTRELARTFRDGWSSMLHLFASMPLFSELISEEDVPKCERFDFMELFEEHGKKLASLLENDELPPLGGAD